MAVEAGVKIVLLLGFLQPGDEFLAAGLILGPGFAGVAFRVSDLGRGLENQCPDESWAVVVDMLHLFDHLGLPGRLDAGHFHGGGFTQEMRPEADPGRR